jgi:hypothetical protein
MCTVATLPWISVLIVYLSQKVTGYELYNRGLIPGKGIYISVFLIVQNVCEIQPPVEWIPWEKQPERKADFSSSVVYSVRGDFPLRLREMWLGSGEVLRTFPPMKRLSFCVVLDADNTSVWRQR